MRLQFKRLFGTATVSQETLNAYKKMLSPAQYQKYMRMAFGQEASDHFLQVVYEAYVFFMNHLQFCWKFGSFGGRLGLNWSEVEVKARMFHCPEHLFELFEIIEELKVEEDVKSQRQK